MGEIDGKTSDISEAFNFLFDMISEKPSDGFKWVDYHLWYFMHGYRLDELTVDEVIEEWKKVCVEDSKSERYLEMLREYIIEDRKTKELEETE